MAYNCEKAQENISAYVDGELGVIDTLLLKLHTIKCKKCREDLNFEKDLVRTMSAENFFLPHNFSESLHKKLETEYTRNPVKNRQTAMVSSAPSSISSVIFGWMKGKRTYLVAAACMLVFVFALSAYQFSVVDNVANVETNEPAMVSAPKGMARVANMDSITDENIASQEIAGVNESVFDKFRNKYMTKKFVANFSVMNDTVGYSTTQKRGITSIMRTIKDVVSDVVSGKKPSLASMPSVNTSINSIKYVRPTTASAKVAVDLREKVPIAVSDESIYGVLMVDRNAINQANSGVSVASSGNYDLRENKSENAAYTPENEKLSFAYSDVVDYSGYTPELLSVKSATFTSEKSKVSAVKDILYEFRNSIEMKETESSITITIDGVNYLVLVSRLKMCNECTFKQMHGRDYSESYNSLIKKQSLLMDDPAKYSELEEVTKEIEELLSKLGNNTITINLE